MQICILKDHVAFKRRPRERKFLLYVTCVSGSFRTSHDLTLWDPFWGVFKNLVLQFVQISCCYSELLLQKYVGWRPSIATGLIKLYVQSRVVVCKLLNQHSSGKLQNILESIWWCNKHAAASWFVWSFCKLMWLTWQIIHSKFVAAAWMTPKVSIEQLVYGIYFFNARKSLYNNKYVDTQYTYVYCSLLLTFYIYGGYNPLNS